MNKTCLYLAVFCMLLSGCGSGATVGIGGSAGSGGSSGGIGISFPMGQDPAGSSSVSSSSSRGDLPNYMTSNLNQPYPDPDCYQPLKPDRDDSAGSFMVYRQQLERYRVCIDTYAAKAKNDMETIEAKANNALREYRLFVSRP